MTDIRRIPVGDATLALRDVGDGPPLVLLHPGFVADGMMPLIEQPALHGYRRIAYHRRGYGESDRASGSRSVQQAAQELIHLLDALHIDRAHLAGHSMGAVVAIQAALDHADRIASLTMMEPLLGFLLRGETAEFVTRTAEVALPRYAAGDREGALDAWLTGAFGAGFRALLDASLPGAWAQAVTDADAAFGTELAALQQWPVGPTDLGRISVPTLSLVHAPDAWAGYAEMHEGLVAAVPGCRAMTVEVPTHLLQIADAPRVAAALAGFLTAQNRMTPSSDRVVH